MSFVSGEAQGLMARWYTSPFTGLFSEAGPVPRYPHDPEVLLWSGTLPRWGPGARDLATGGAGWDEEAAERAGLGEGVERWSPAPLPCDHSLLTSCADWREEEPALGPERWVLFHPAQYAQPGFPFQPFTRETVVRWSCCRVAGSGEAVWVPEEFLYLAPRPGERHHLGPTVSTGLSAGRETDLVLLRGLQEVIERDALVGAWWGRYPLQEHDPGKVWASLPGRGQARRLQRPNLHYRFFHIATPFSGHVTLVTLEGEEREGVCFSVGSACRETRAASWEKALLEAVQGRHYVRQLKSLWVQTGQPLPGREEPTDFASHALYYTLHREQLQRTIFYHASGVTSSEHASAEERLAQLAERLAERPILFRHLTPPSLLAEQLGWLVVRVLVPGLQPLHGHHGYPLLGGPLWAPRTLEDWKEIPPHPFP
jgi:ribosomal protein S12 methylthiotransferase accessory factor